MNKNMITIIITISIILVIALCIILYSVFRDKPTYTPIDGELINVEFSSAGGMEGGYTSIEITKESDTTAKVQYNYQEYHNAPEIKKDFIVDVQVLKDIEKVFRDNKMETWNDLPLSEEQVLDAPIDHFYFKFENGETVSFNDGQQYPNDNFDAVRSIYNLIKSVND